MHQKIIIAIDGYSSCGKSTLARQLAQQLQYVYVDSGAMYRAVTLFFLQHKVNLVDVNAVEQALKNIDLYFLFNHKTLNSDIYLNDKDVEVQIRQMQISEKVSDVAALKEVRNFTVLQQRSMGRNSGIVMDGRDIGTTVFPKAELKVFMTADIEVRVQRRFKELHALNKSITLKEVKENLEMRDKIDTQRTFSPLRKAEDAVMLDNTHLTIEEQLNIVLKWAEERIALIKNIITQAAEK